MEMRLDGPQIAVFMDFENVATSAEATLGDFDVNAVMALLRSRGRLLIKRAYADWGRFPRYRRALLESGVDLFQLYSFGMQQKNRADVRLAIDAMEVVFTRPNIDVYAILSGDSDFTELIHKLRDHGKYTIGIGLHSATSDLLRRACDEFIFYETLVSEELTDIADELQLPDPRELLHGALLAAAQKGETPIFAGRLKQIMLGLDSAFSEANYGFSQFRAFLEAYQDLITIQEQGLQLYINLRQPEAPPPTPPNVAKPIADPGQRYRSFLREAGLRVVEPSVRRQVLADFLATVGDHREPLSLNAVADLLRDRYDTENALTPKVAVPEMMRLLVMSDALTFAGGQATGDAPLLNTGELALERLSEACEMAYVWRLVEGGVPIYPEQLAPVLFGPDADAGPVTALCRKLIGEDRIIPAGDAFTIAPAQVNRLLQRTELATAISNLNRVGLPPGEPISLLTAEELFREASELRQKDFTGSAQRYLQAARIQLELLRTGQARAGFDDFKWYLASYCSAKAGHAFVSNSYADAVPYYLGFFGLAQEADGVWPRIQRLVNPMCSYFFAIAGKQLGEGVPPNLGRSLPAQVALQIHNHKNPEVGRTWEQLMERLADVNLGMIRQIWREVRGFMSPANPQGTQSPGDAGDSSGMRAEHTRTFLAELIAQREAANG